MNSKKAKKLRQLVRHLVEKSGASKETSYDEKQFTSFDMIQRLGEEESMREVMRVTRTLSQNSARAVYQQMKKNA